MMRLTQNIKLLTGYYGHWVRYISKLLRWTKESRDCNQRIHVREFEGGGAHGRLQIKAGTNLVVNHYCVILSMSPGRQKLLQSATGSADFLGGTCNFVLFPFVSLALEGFFCRLLVLFVLLFQCWFMACRREEESYPSQSLQDTEGPDTQDWRVYFNSFVHKLESAPIVVKFVVSDACRMCLNPVHLTG